MMENMLLVQLKKDEYIKQLASKVNVLATHNKMLEAQIAQQAAPLSIPLGRFSSKNELSHGEQYNAMILRGGNQLKGPKGVSQDEHLYDENDEVVEKEVSASSNDIIGVDAHNSNKVPNDPKKITIR